MQDIERWWQRVYLAVLVCGFVVVCLGAWTRLADAGLGCPDWPGCYGELLMPDSAEEALSAYPDSPLEPEKALLEMVHRYIAGIFGLGILALFILARVGGDTHRYIGEDTRRKRLTACLLLLVVAQAGLGALTVTMLLFPPIVLAHLLMGFTTVILLWSLRSSPRRRIQVSHLKPHLALAWFVLVLQVALGGWMSANYAALACPDFPTCQGELWPSMNIGEALNTGPESDASYLGGKMGAEGRKTVHAAHRFNAFIVLFVLTSLFWRLRATSGVHVSATLGLSLLWVQVLSGITLVLLGIPLLLAVLHNFMALLLALCLAHISVNAWRRPEVTLGQQSGDLAMRS